MAQAVCCCLRVKFCFTNFPGFFWRFFWKEEEEVNKEDKGKINTNSSCWLAGWLAGTYSMLYQRTRTQAIRWTVSEHTHALTNVSLFLFALGLTAKQSPKAFEGL
jgi:hypothetical protein